MLARATDGRQMIHEVYQARQVILAMLDTYNERPRRTSHRQIGTLREEITAVDVYLDNGHSGGDAWGVARWQVFAGREVAQ